MPRLHRLLFSTLLLIAIIISVNYSMVPETQASTPTKFTIEMDGNEIETIDIPVSTEFTIEIWIRDIPDGFSVIGLDFFVMWDPELVEYLYHTTNDHGWDHSHDVNEELGYLWFNYPLDTGHEVDYDDVWATIIFHCLGEGTSKITIESIDTIYIWNGETTLGIDPPPVEVTCNQLLRAPVGGVASPTNKLEILTPYIALTALIVAVSTVYIIKKRKD
jgi:hypothetical protein